MLLPKWKHWVMGSDLHGDMQDPQAVRVFHKFNREVQPEIRWFLGDLWDFRPLRRGADEEEKRQEMGGDFNAGMRFIREFKPTEMALGNHDMRLWYLSRKRKGIMSEYADSLIARFDNYMNGIGARVAPYASHNGQLKIGHLKGVHGFAAGINASRRHAQAFGAVHTGHGHGIQVSPVEGMDNRIGRMIGCLCDLYMEYSHNTLGQLLHRHGFAHGVVNTKTGDYFSLQAESINGKWIIPTEMREFR